MSDAWFDIGKIKIAMKRAGSGPIPFAFGVGGKLDEGQLAMHLKRPPQFLGKVLKKEGFSPARILIGTAETNGSLLTVTVEKEIPKSKKAIKFFLKQNKLLQKKVQLIGPDGEFDSGEDEDEQDTTGVAEPEPTDEDLDGAWFDIGKIKVAMKRAANGPIPFAFGVGGKLEEGQLAMHMKRPPQFLGKALKKEGFSPARTLIGTAETNGTLLTVTVEKEIPKSKKAIKFYLKQNKLLQKKVMLIGPDGEFDAGDDEDEQDATGVASDSSGQEQVAFKRRLVGISPRFKKVLTERGAEAKPLVVKFKQAHALGKNGDYGRALALLDELDELLEDNPKSSPQADALGEEWNKRVKKLAPQIKEVLTAKREGSRDIALKFKQAQGFQSKQDFEAGIAMLDEISIMIENLKGDNDKANAEWTQRFKALEPDLASVLEQDLGDPSKLRAARDMAMEKAESGDHVTALKILDRLQPAVAQALSSAIPSGEDKRKADSVFSFDYRKALLQYAVAKDSVNKALRGFVSDTKAQLPEQASLASAIHDMVYELNDELYDEVDEALDSTAVNASDYHTAVKKVIDNYRGLIRGSDIIKHLDQKPVALGIGNTLIGALDKLNKAIAA